VPAGESVLIQPIGRGITQAFGGLLEEGCSGCGKGVYFEGVVGEAMVFFSWLVEHGGGSGGGDLGSVLVSLDGMRWFVVLNMWYFN
jgi:hypothetical protein